MKMLLIGTPRQPTLNVGSNGLGRYTHDIINQLRKQKGISITTMLHRDSSLEWDDIKILPFMHEINDMPKIKEHILQEKYDFIFDFTHWHMLNRSIENSDLPIINFILDEECNYNPPNCIIGNEWQKRRYTNSKTFVTGIDIGKYPLFLKKEDYLSFCGKIEHRKGYDIANLIGKKSRQKVIFAGPDNDGRASELDNWIGEITNHKQFCDFVGHSKCLLYPSRSDAGGMAIWEAMALGTPTITTNKSGAQYHVADGKTGFVVQSIEQAIEAVQKVDSLDVQEIRDVCEQRWDLNKNFLVLFEQVIKFVEGERW